MADIQKIDSEDQADRCQAINSQGQCRNVAHPGSSYCLAHGGNKAGQAAEKDALRNYALDKWQARLDQKKASPEIKGLRDEIGILRILLEDRLNQCQSATDLMLHTSAVSDLIMKIEKVVASCHKLERNMGMVLDKQAILNFAGRVIQIITMVLEDDQDKVDEIADHILEELGQCTS
jgi:hypothetical protein